MLVTTTVVEYRCFVGWKPPVVVHSHKAVCPTEFIELFIEDLLNDFGVVPESIKIVKMVGIDENILKEVKRGEEALDVDGIYKFIDALETLRKASGMNVSKLVYFGEYKPKYEN